MRRAKKAERLKMKTPEEIRVPIAEKLLAAAEPGSNEHLLVEQIECSRHNRRAAQLQSRLYAELSRLANENDARRMEGAMYWERTISGRYLPPVIEFFAAMEQYWRAWVSSLPKDHSVELSCYAYDFGNGAKHRDDDSALVFATHLGVRPVCDLPMSPLPLSQALALQAANTEENFGHSVTRSQRRAWEEREQKIRNLEKAWEGCEPIHYQIYSEPLAALQRCYSELVSNIFRPEDSLTPLRKSHENLSGNSTGGN